MDAASETTTPVRMDASGQIGNLIAGFGKNACCQNADIAVLAIYIQMAVPIGAELFRVLLPGFKRKVDC